MLRTKPHEDLPIEIHTRNGLFDFQVQACQEAHIKLRKNNDEYYNVLIGTTLSDSKLYDFYTQSKEFGFRLGQLGKH